MSVKKTVDEALSKKMSRKDFLGQVGAVLLAVVGVSAILRSLGTTHGGSRSSAGSQSQSTSGNNVGGAYGSSSYGG